MEDPFRPQHPQSFGAPYSQQESNCRIEELTRALGRSTRITPVRFAWLSPANLCAEMLGKAGRSTAPLLIVDVRESGESSGGHITGAQCSGGDINASQLRDLAERWRAGSHIVLYCTRSQSRAPLAASRLLKQLEDAGPAASRDQAHADGPRVSVLEGGIVALVEHVFHAVQGGEMSGGVEECSPPDELLREYDASFWMLRMEREGAVLIHASEHALDSQQESQVSLIVEAEVSDELAFLVDQRMSLSPAQAQSMPYIS
mmetsp:Transcript_67387/g.159847  ORF Transcript_67387/g.159847 Transcript_67387/m.159847 type:complete len:259 (+) Transcript_67387:273-1049(+)